MIYEVFRVLIFGQRGVIATNVTLVLLVLPASTGHILGAAPISSYCLALIMAEFYKLFDCSHFCKPACRNRVFRLYISVSSDKWRLQWFASTTTQTTTDRRPLKLILVLQSIAVELPIPVNYK